MTSDAILEFEDLSVVFPTTDGDLHAVDGLTYAVHSGEVVGVVGESGCGKSVAAMAVLGLVTPPGRIDRGCVRYQGQAISSLPPRELRRLRGGEVSMVFQDATTALNPVMSVGNQIAESLHLHNKKLSRSMVRNRALELLEQVGIPEPARRAKQFPHQLSGGMRQRVMIAMAVANGPRLIIADEPTTALDVTIQAQILELLREHQRTSGAAVVFISHNMGVIAELADRVCVMYAGRVVEQGRVADVFSAPAHPYTKGLLDSLPSAVEEMDELRPIPGSPPNLIELPSGCRFHPRCSLRAGRALCAEVDPPLLLVASERSAACHFSDELGLGGAPLALTLDDRRG